MKRVGAQVAAPKRGVPDATGDGGEKRARGAPRGAEHVDFPADWTPEDARQVHVHRAAAMGGGGVKEAQQSRDGGVRAFAGARARRPRQGRPREREVEETARAAAVPSAQCPPPRRETETSTRTFCLRASACAARCARGRTPRTRWPPSSSPRCARSRARPASNGSSGAWTTAGARRSSARTPRRASRRLPVFLRRLPGARRAVPRAGRRGAFPKKKRRRRQRDVTRRCRVTRGWWVRGGHGGEFREVPGRARGGARPARVRGRRNCFLRARGARAARAYTEIQRRAGAGRRRARARRRVRTASRWRSGRRRTSRRRTRMRRTSRRWTRTASPWCARPSAWRAATGRSGAARRARRAAGGARAGRRRRARAGVPADGG